MVVRNPFDRLLSSYLDKAFPRRNSDNDIQKYYYAIENYVLSHNMTSPEQWRAQKGIATFEQFLNYALIKKPDDHHWRPLHKFCDPCSIKYDHILRVETMQHDSKQLLSKLYPDVLELPNSNPSKSIFNFQPSTKAAAKPLHKYYSSLPRWMVEKLVEMYQLDLQLFGYTFSDSNFLAGCSFTNVDCC